MVVRAPAQEARDPGPAPVLRGALADVAAPDSTRASYSRPDGASPRTKRSTSIAAKSACAPDGTWYIAIVIGMIRGAVASGAGEYFRYPMTMRFLG